MRYRSFLPCFGLALIAVSSALSAETASEAVSVSEPYVRAVPPGQPNSASFMVLSNGSAQEHALVAAESPAARVVELHSHVMEDGMMSMRRVHKIELPPGATVVLEPGGLHVMMIGLEQSLEPDQEIPISLLFDDGSRTEVLAPVRRIHMHMNH